MTYPPRPPVVVIARQPPTSGLAVASLVFSIIGLLTGCCTFGVFSLLAVILGHIGALETRDGAKSGHGMAMAGLIMGYLVIGPAIALSTLGAGHEIASAIVGGDPTPSPS